MKSIDNFSYVTSTVITPLFLVAGTFFPISGLPEWAQVAAWFNPLYHCVQLVRHAAFGFEGLVDLAHLGILLGFGLLMWRLAIWRTARRLID
jgi:lipooligosaccharide transport system permease protein